MSTNAMPVSVGREERNCLNASKPPADAPTPTTKTSATEGRRPERLWLCGALTFADDGFGDVARRWRLERTDLSELRRTMDPRSNNRTWLWNKERPSKCF